jgi:hypothetical protein
MKPPAPFIHRSPHQLHIAEGGGCLALFGLPFLAAGVFMLLASVGIVPLQADDSVPSWSFLVLGAMGVVFTLVGGHLALGRRWIIVDTRRARITQQWGLLVPLQATERRLDDYSHVRLCLEKGDADTSDHFPVLLAAAHGQADMRLCSVTAYEDARQQAAYLATFLQWPLEDQTTVHHEVLTPDAVNLPWVERRRALLTTDAVPCPFHLRSQLTRTATGLTIIIPGPGFHPASLIGVVFLFMIVLLVAPMLFRFFRATDTPDVVGYAVFGALMLFFVVFPLVEVVHAIARARRSRTTLTVDMRGVSIEERGAWRSVSTTIPRHEIMDLDYHTAHATWDSAMASLPSQTPQSSSLARWLMRLKPLATSQGVMFKTTRGLVTVAAGLPDEEVRYLYGLIAQTLIDTSAV